MKLLHLADLHIGRRLMDVSLLEDQRYIFSEILRIMDKEQPDAVLICGDVYDRSSPSAEAMELLDDLLSQLASRKKPVFIISGNHDSSERLAFASHFFRNSRIHISPVYNGHIEPIPLQDGFGTVNFWLMPYIHPDNAARFFPEKELRTANDAVEAVISEMAVNPEERNVILSHQFLLGGETSESERRYIGTLENVDVSLYHAFDYVALGHLHRPQDVGREEGTMRYAGTPLCYSRSEMNAEKSVTIVEMQEKGKVSVHTVPLRPLRPLHVFRGLFADLLCAGPTPGTEQDFCFIDLTDEDDIPNAASRLKERFPGMLSMRYDNQRTRCFQAIDAPESMQEKQPLELMAELYRLTHPQQEMSEDAIRFVLDTIKQMGGMPE